MRRSGSGCKVRIPGVNPPEMNDSKQRRGLLPSGNKPLLDSVLSFFFSFLCLCDYIFSKLSMKFFIVIEFYFERTCT